MAFNADSLAQTYSPRPQDADAETFLGRLQACQACPLRNGSQCSALQTLCSVAARRQPANCPHHRWPGEAPPAGPQRHKVVLLSPSLHPGGAERWMISLARWLPQFGPLEISAAVITAPNVVDAGMRTELERYTRVLVCDGRPQPCFPAAEALREADVVLVWGLGDLTWWVEGISARVVWVSHGSGEWTQQHAEQAAPRVTHWAAVSAMAKSGIPERYRDQIEVLHNGAEIERCVPAIGRDETRRRWGLTEDQVAVGYIGRFSPEKRPCGVAEAVRHLPDNYVAVMIGDGWKGAETREQAEQLAPGRVIFPGHMTHIGDALAAIDVWVNVSPAEGFSLSLIEAWLAGVPVVSTPTGAIPELEQAHGRLVRTVPVGVEGSQLAREIDIELTFTHSIRVFGLLEHPFDRARDLAWREFTAAAMGRRWAAWLQELLRPADAPPAVEKTRWWARWLPAWLRPDA